MRILEFLAERPKEAFTISEIAERLRIVPSTCLGILAELADGAYVTRVPETKRYRLGPGLLALGRAARQGYGVIELVQDDLERLTRRFGVPCTISTVTANLIVVLDRTGPVGPFDQFVQAGQEYPYAPPSGVVFSVWMSDAEIDQWLASYPSAGVDRRRVQALADSSRRLGFIVERFSDTSARSLTILARLVEHEDDPEMRRAFEEIISIFPDRYYLDHELQASDVLPVTLVCAPVYGPTGHPDFLLGALVFSTLARQQLLELAGDLRTTAESATRQLGGRDPWAPVRGVTAGQRVGDEEPWAFQRSSTTSPSAATTGGAGVRKTRSAR